MSCENEQATRTTPAATDNDERDSSSTSLRGAADGADDTPHTEPSDNPPEGEIEEIGGRPGPDPSRYGDWEKNGRCIDF